MVRVMVICDKYYGVCGEYWDGEDGGENYDDGGENYDDVDYNYVDGILPNRHFRRHCRTALGCLAACNSWNSLSTDFP